MGRIQDCSMGHTSVNVAGGYSVDLNTDWKEILVGGAIAVIILIVICVLIFCVCRGGCHGIKTSKKIIKDGENQKEATFGLVFLNVIINLSLFTSIDLTF